MVPSVIMVLLSGILSLCYNSVFFWKQTKKNVFFRKVLVRFKVCG